MLVRARHCMVTDTRAALTPMVNAPGLDLCATADAGRSTADPGLTLDIPAIRGGRGSHSFICVHSPASQPILAAHASAPATAGEPRGLYGVMLQGDLHFTRCFQLVRFRAEGWATHLLLGAVLDLAAAEAERPVGARGAADAAGRL